MPDVPQVAWLPQVCVLLIHRCKVRAGPGRQRLGAGSSSSSAAQRCLTALQLTRLIVSCRSVNRRPAQHADVPNNVRPADANGEHLTASTARRPSMSFGATRGRARHGAAAASSAHACEHSGRRTATRTRARTRCAQASKAYAIRQQSHSHSGRILGLRRRAARPCRRSDHAASH